METIDEHRGLLHGGADGLGISFDDAFVLDLREKVSPNYARKYLINCNRNGFASISSQNHPLDIITECVDWSKEDS